MRIKALRSMLHASSMLGLGMGMPAFAQDGARVPETNTDIVVTARRSEERLQDEPVGDRELQQQQHCQRASPH